MRYCVLKKYNTCIQELRVVSRSIHAYRYSQGTIQEMHPSWPHNSRLWVSRGHGFQKQNASTSITQQEFYWIKLHLLTIMAKRSRD